MSGVETHSMAPSPLEQRASAAAASFSFSAAQANAAVRHMVQHLDTSLTAHGATQIPSFISRIPSGSEAGIFLGVDLGGTNCRVCSVEFHGDSTYTLLQAAHEIPRPLMTEHDYHPLFLFIAECIRTFLSTHPHLLAAQTTTTATAAITTQLPLGFIFSFTFEQHSLARGTLLQWDKGWTIPSAIGRDPCAMLQEAVDQVNLPVRVCALANDSVGTLLARAYTTPSPRGPLIGAIFGTGTNAAYVERRSKVRKLPGGHGDGAADDGLMLMNTEWGACFDDAGDELAPTAYDAAMDAASTNPGLQILEKRVGGMYLGELLRLSVRDIFAAGLFSFTLASDAPLLSENQVDSEILSVLAAQKPDDEVRAFVEKTLGLQGVTAADVHAIRIISTAIGTRAARIAGVAVAAIIIQSGRLDRGASSSDLSEELSKTEKDDAPTVAEDEHIQEAGCGSVFSLLSRAVRSLLACFTNPASTQKSSPSIKPTASPSSTKPASDVIDIGVDGSLIEFYPSFEADLRSALRDITEIGAAGEERVTIGLAKNGSSIGAAIAALYQSAEDADKKTSPS
ncbi:hypothetical protein TD95_001629 [Thielaviopsis punctulata]|uniref:Phosphotransferase n=1 Tax=Thielaviopsis punctulata TaxID=72032 RepID=A0A0F4Z8J5_9PEZI|nr:hypothetical protein TD95_001629 [Thielaviopsis punctulata]